MTDTDPRAIIPPPAPAFLSEQARRIIEEPIVVGPMPALDDHDAWLANIAQTDAEILASMPTGPLPVTTTLRTVSGVPVHEIVPDGVDPEGSVHLYIHGGALIYAAGAVGCRMAELDTVATGVVHWSVDYRMPPRHPFPAALDDVTAVYRALLEVRRPSQIIVGGGSAGGNLAAALMLRAAAEGLPMPAGLVLHTPEVDLTESGDTFETLRHVSVRLQSLRQINLLYAAGADLSDPLLSPLFGDVSTFPPTLLVAGTRDLFLSNTVRMHRALREAGVDADLHVFDARPHAGFGQAPEEEAVDRETRLFVQRHLAAASA